MIVLLSYFIYRSVATNYCCNDYYFQFVIELPSRILDIIIDCTANAFSVYILKGTIIVRYWLLFGAAATLGSRIVRKSHSPNGLTPFCRRLRCRFGRRTSPAGHRCPEMTAQTPWSCVTWRQQLPMIFLISIHLSGRHSCTLGPQHPSVLRAMRLAQCLFNFATRELCQSLWIF